MICISLYSVGKCIHRPSSLSLGPLFLPLFARFHLFLTHCQHVPLKQLTKFASLKAMKSILSSQPRVHISKLSSHTVETLANK